MNHLRCDADRNLRRCLRADGEPNWRMQAFELRICQPFRQKPFFGERDFLLAADAADIIGGRPQQPAQNLIIRLVLKKMVLLISLLLKFIIT